MLAIDPRPIDPQSPAAPPSGALERRRYTVRGLVQGVGFRPFVHRLATRLNLAGQVRNDAHGVCIEVEGAAAGLDAFAQALRTEAPAGARIDAVQCVPLAPTGAAGFTIMASEAADATHAAPYAAALTAAIGPDRATCPDCLAELFAPANRRWRYPFINCTQCGPRYTITRALPYDRASTSMAGFALCAECAREYGAPADRRFHAEPNACAVCGPRLALHDADGAQLAVPDVIADVLARLQRGEVIALKGLGGFQLACDARNAAAVARLRERKQREEKPFAVMAANAASLAEVMRLDAATIAALEDPARPIVLAPKTPACDEQLAGLAPGVAWLGAMLPATPLHWLLWHEAAGRPAGTAWLAQAQPLLLVMTSANPHGEPLVRDNAEALARLAGIADAFVLHDRDIVVRADDSVLRVLGGANAPDAAPQFLRRARGYTPQAIALSRASAPVLAFGGWYKNTVCCTRGAEAFVSQHIGDLDNAATCNFQDESVAHLLSLLAVQPALIAHDLHPDFHSTRAAVAFAERLGVPALAVQHHHAHLAAVLAEHGVDEPALGLALDGVGLGSDGSAWGGELLRIDGARCTRLGHLRALPLPGGDRAAREPWRLGAAVLHLLGRADEIPTRYAHEAGAATVAQMLARGLQCPLTSSAGRWFDAAAGLLGTRARMSFEGQAAMELEGLAARVWHDALRAPLALDAAQDVLDPLPLLAVLVHAPDAATGAAWFHAGLADALVAWAARAAERAGLRTIVAGGGCWLNALLAGRVRAGLAERGLRLLEARRVPPNDGGLALGQAWVAQQHLLQ